MKTRIASLVVALGTLAATTVHADETAVTAQAPAKKMRVGAQLELLPVGTLEASAGGRSESTDTATAYGIGGTFDVDVTPNISVGVAPRLILGLKGEDGDDSAKQLDLRARLTAHFPVADKLTAYAFAAPGYSVIFVPDSADLDNPAGFVLGFGAGAAYDVAPNLFVSAEVGYQLGFQGTTVAGQDVDLKSDLLSIGIGAGTRF